MKILKPTFVFWVLFLVAFLPFLSFRTGASSFGQSYLFFERMNTGVSSGLIAMFTPVSDFDESETEKVFRIYFPPGDVGNDRWCLQNGMALAVSGVAASPVDSGDWGIDAVLPGGINLQATCYQGGVGEMDYIEITGIGNLVAGTSYGFEIGEDEAVFKTGWSSGGNLISFQILEGTNQASISFETNLLSDDQVFVEAYVSEANTITCTVGNNVNLGTLFLGGAYVTGNHGLSSHSAGSGFYWAVYGEGNGTTPGLTHQTVSSEVLSSLGDGSVVSLISGEGFGLVVSNSNLGTIPANYQYTTPGIFGAIHIEPRLLLQSEVEGEGAYTITLGTRAGISAMSGPYQEILTYVCGGYIGDVAPEVPANACNDETTAQMHGETYDIVAIGGQCWMAENLNYDSGCSTSTWVDYSDEGWCGCYLNNPDNCNTYGLLYQWSAAMNSSTTEGDQGVCPVGWHLPTDDDWKELEMELGMSILDANSTGWRNSGDVGEKLKTSSWGGDNSSGFTALPGGNRIESGIFSGFAGAANFWTSSPDGGSAWGRPLGSAHSGVGRELGDKAAGYSVRCIKN